MDDPFFVEDEGEFDDFYGNGARSARPSQTVKPDTDQSHRPPVRQVAPLAYPDTPASSAGSFVSRSTDGGLMSVSTTTPRPYSSEHTQKRHKKMRRRRSQERFEVEWENDDDVVACFVCTNEFSLLKRKHHCRHCGRVICSDCSSFRRFSSSRGKHRVCSYCSVDLANGVSRHTIAGRMSTSDAEVATPNHIDAHGHRDTTNVRKSVVRVFTSKSRDKSGSQDAAVPSNPTSSSRRRKSSDIATQEHTNELFDTSDDMWFSDPVDEDGSGGQLKHDNPQKQHTQSTPRDRNSYARPQVINPPDSLFDVHFTNGNQRDNAASDKNILSMPRPSSGDSGHSTHTGSRRTVIGRSNDRMTIDELGASSATAYALATNPYESALVVVPSSSKTTDRTFYSDDADRLVVDEAPGFYESMMSDQHKYRSSTPAYSNPTHIPRPSTLAAVSDESSGTLVEVPDMNALTTPAVVEKREDPPTQGKGFTGALKRFFGISKKKGRGPPISDSHTVNTAPAEKNILTASQDEPPIIDVDAAERASPSKMPRPEVVPDVIFDHYDMKKSSDDGSRRFDDDGIRNDRYTISDVNDIRVESKPTPASASFRHSMTTYSQREAQMLGESTENSLLPAAVQLVGAQEERKGRRRSTRSRRDTFDNLFDSPTKARQSTYVAPISNLPTRSWAAVPYDGHSAVGVDRFDRPRQDDPDDDIALNLGLPLSDERHHTNARSPTTRIPWSAVSSYRGSTDAPTFAVPNSFSTRDYGYYDARETQAETLVDAVHPFESGEQHDATSNSEPNRTIMDDLKPTSTKSNRVSERQRDSVDDYFADFEKQTEYIFDAASGSYVPTNSVQASRSSHQTSTPVSYALSTPPSAPTHPSQGYRDQVPLRGPEALDSVHGNGSDEIDGIIADKISTLAGELEALKQLLRQRRGGASSASRKQSIFDNDSSGEEHDIPVKIPAAKKGRSSRRETPGTEVKRTKNRRQRKDSFAALFEEDEEVSDRKGVLPTRNYEALFQIGQKQSGSGDDSGDERAKRRTRRERDAHRIKDQRRSGSESESDQPSARDTHDHLGEASRFGRPAEPDSLSSLTPRRNSDERRSTVNIVDHPQLVPTKKPKRKDVIDSLFDSDTEQDMGELYATSASTRTNTSAAKNQVLGYGSESDDNIDNSRKEDLASESRNNQEGQMIVHHEPTTDVPPSESSDEEFSSTLRNLRARRKPPAKVVDSSVSLLSPESSEGEELAQPSTILTLMSSTRGEVQSVSSDDEVVEQRVVSPDHIEGARLSEGKLAAFGDSVGINRIITKDDGMIPAASETVSEAVDKSAKGNLQGDRQLVGERSLSMEAGGDTVKGSEEFLPLPSFTRSNHDFDPLELYDDESKIKQSTTTSADSNVGDSSTAIPQGWGIDVDTIGDRLKALRFRDSLLDSSPSDLLGKSPSLNLDDLLNDTPGDLVGEADGDVDGGKSTFDEEEPYSFEIKPKKQANKESYMPSDSSKQVLPFGEDAVLAVERENQAMFRHTRQVVPAQDVMQTLERNGDENVEEDSAWGTMTIASSNDDMEVPSSADSAQFQDDWQRMQEQERERKKKLQMKQRQAQREKLKKQASSGRSLGKLSSSRVLAPSAAGSTSNNLVEIDGEDSGGSKVKKKKKHHKKVDYAQGEEDGDLKSRRKSDNRRHRREVAKDGEGAIDQVPPPGFLTEL